MDTKKQVCAKLFELLQDEKNWDYHYTSYNGKQLSYKFGQMKLSLQWDRFNLLSPYDFKLGWLRCFKLWLKARQVWKKRYKAEKYQRANREAQKVLDFISNI